MNDKNITTIRIHVDSENVETKLFRSGDDYRVRLRDLDAERNITVVFCQDLDHARAKFAEATSLSLGGRKQNVSFPVG